MANEFIARKGLIALEDSQITGSLSVSSDITGSEARLSSIMPSQGSVRIGYQAGQNVNSNAEVAIGYQALANHTAYTGIAIGYQAAKNMTQPGDIVHIGYAAGTNAGTSGNTIFIGRDAGYNRVNSTLAIALGTRAMRDGSGNSIGIGNNALSRTVGSGNVAIGNQAGGLYNNSRTISDSVMIGDLAGRDNNGSKNVLVGNKAGQKGADFVNSTVIGYEAGYNLTGSNNVLLGYQAGYNLTGSNQLIITNTGSHALVTGDFANNTFDISGSVSASTYYGDGSNLTGISSDPFPYTGSAIITGSLEVVGEITGSSQLKIDGDLHIGGSTGTFGVNFLAGSPSVTSKNYTNTRIIAIANAIGFGSSNSYNTVKIGTRTVGGGNYSIVIGDETATNNTGGHIIAIGAASSRFSTGNSTVALGQNTLYGLGAKPGGSNYVIALGSHAGYQQGGENNILIGVNAGRTLEGSYNTVLGYQAGYNLSGSKNVVLGYQAGYNLTGSNQLIIANTGSHALIEGDFANETVTISGSLSVSESITASNAQLTTITGPSDQLLELGNYPVGYDIISAFAITGSGLIVSASTLASNHYNMVKIGDIELIDLKSIVNPNTFLIHNVDQFSITSGSDGGDIGSDNYLMTHTGESFVVHNNGTNMLSITNGAVQFTSNTTGISLLTSTGNINTRINTEVTNTASLHSFAVYDSDPSSAAGAAIKNIDASKIAYSQVVSGSLVYFGEESGNLSTAGNGLQFSYGNGAVGSIGIPVPVDCYAKKLMFQAETFGTSCTIDLYTGSITTNPVTATGEGMTITGTEHSKVVDINPVFIAAGHYPVFKTAAVSGTYGNVRVGVFLEYPIQI